MQKLWIKNPLAIHAANAGGGILVHNGVILELIPAGHSPTPPFDTFDASAHVILPGLINTHHHFYQTLTRAVRPALGKGLFGWLRALYPIWAHLTPDDLAVATELALTELLLSGCTTSSDHHYLFPAALRDAIDVQAQAAKHSGVRVMLARGSMNLSQKDGGLPPDSVVQEADAILKDSERVVKQYHDPRDGSMMQVALAPCSPFSVTETLMKDTAALASSLHVRLHTHLGETIDENEFCEEKLGQRPIDYLEHCGWLGAQTWIAHGIHFSLEEISRLGAAKTAVTHCPHSNMILGSGICPACSLRDAGSPVGLGVDGSASNDASSMIDEVRAATLIQRLDQGAAGFSHLDAIQLATEGSAACLGRADIGIITPGKQADLAMFKLNELKHSGHDDPLAALVLSGAGRADRVMIKGEWRVEDGRAVGVDETDLMRRHADAARGLRQRAGLQS